MSVVSKPRLGKRPPLGGLVCGPCPSPEGLGVPGDLGAEMTAGMGGPTFRQGYQGFGSVKLFAGQRTIAMAMTQHPQVYLSCCGEQCTGVPEPRNHGDSKASVFLPQRGLHTPPKAQDDIWATPTSQPPATPLLRPVSSSINTSEGYRSPEPVDMDEIMAAMVLTSLSYSPAIQSPPMRGPSAAPSEMECSGGEELSDSSSSGYWSWDHGVGSPAPSPSVTEATDATLAPSADEGIDIDMEQDLCTGPVTRKHKNPVRLAYRCLWPSCGKVLTSVVGMKRHIRILHLGHSSESEQSQREEDFYYTEIHRRLASRPPSVPPSAHCASPPNPSMEIRAGTPPPSLLSQSAPDSYCQVQSEQLYQACPPVQVAVSPSSPCWSPPVTVLQSTQSCPFRSRSVSVGEQWAPQHSAPLRPHPISRSPPHTHCASRKVRGEAKKCRKVYGIDHRDQWCTACRWKKACQRFVD
ncbi:hypothetical protein AGOR_G00087190 [Albula goreensis]|uniref:C2H2-type domain-containing protein n=1 Tax=Albula goreensis TaxID=1534307 RepID=A0A8T3DJY7_9TELE|nr:hypothetical protein AGOR_G00087190 [Albula goreensis]